MLLIGCHALSIPPLSFQPTPSLSPTLSFQTTPLPPHLSLPYFFLPVVALLSTSISVSSSLISMLWHFSEPLSGFRPNCFKLADGSPLQEGKTHKLSTVNINTVYNVNVDKLLLQMSIDCIPCFSGGRGAGFDKSMKCLLTTVCSNKLVIINSLVVLTLARVTFFT